MRTTQDSSDARANLACNGRTLVIDCATEACSVALFENDDLVASDLRMLGRGHAEALIPMIAALPGKGRAGRIAVSLGPGSFTGVRVGLAAARGLALAWSSQLVGYSSLALIAAMARARHGTVAVGVAMTGGHGEWFVEGFDAQGRSARALASLPPAAAVEASTEDLVAGNQAEALIVTRGRGHAFPTLPDARAFFLLPPAAWQQAAMPIYGRAPDARPPVADAVARTP